MKKALLTLAAVMAISTPALADTEYLTNGTFDATSAPVITGKVTNATISSAPTGWVYYTAVSDTAKDGTSLGSGYGVASGDIQEGLSTTAGYNMTKLNDGNFYYMSARGGNTSGGCNGIYQTVDLAAGTYTLSGTLAALNMGMSGFNNETWYAWEVGLIAGEWGENEDEVPPLYGSSGQRVPEIGAASDTFGIWGGKNQLSSGQSAIYTLSSSNAMAGRTNVMHLAAGKYSVYIQAATNYSADTSNKARFKLMADNMSLTGIEDPAAVPEPGTLLAAFSVLAPVGVVFRRKK